MCALVPAAAALQQSSSADAAAKKPAAKSTTTTHKPAAKKKPTAGSSPHSSTTTGKTHTASGKHPSRKKVVRVRGQLKIDSDRAQKIQEALIREHYLTGEPSGTWNQASEDAMRRYQGDHGWQTKEVPDSRALIKLGLGPSNDHLLNPDSAMTSVPVASQSASSAPTSHSPDPETHTGKNPASPADPRPATTPEQQGAPHPQ